MFASARSLKTHKTGVRHCVDSSFFAFRSCWNPLVSNLVDKASRQGCFWTKLSAHGHVTRIAFYCRPEICPTRLGSAIPICCKLQPALTLPLRVNKVKHRCSYLQRSGQANQNIAILPSLQEDKPTPSSAKKHSKQHGFGGVVQA